MVESNEASTSDRLLGRGIYDLVEAGRMVSRDPETLARWTRGKQPLHPVANTMFFTFFDMISLLVISELVTRGVPKEKIKAGADYLANTLGTDYPFARKELATVGAAFFANVDEWIDVGMGGQRAFEFVQDLLRPIKYGSDHLAAIWRPRSGIWVNPAVQAGAACIDGTRIPTRVIADLEEAGEDPEDIADDLRLDVADVRAAVEYERAA